MNAFPAKIIIEKNRIYSENSNKPHGSGTINPENFSTFPKNPVIARVFKEIGLADELGSGIRNLVKYGKFYSNSIPKLVEEDIFTCTISLSDKDRTGSGLIKLGESSEKILALIRETPDISAESIATQIGISSRAVEKNIAALKLKGLLKRVGPAKGGHWELLNGRPKK